MAIDFSQVKSITISEGVVKKIEDANGNVLWVEPAVARNLAINFVRTFCIAVKVNGTVDCFTKTDMASISPGSDTSGVASLYMSCKLDGGSSQGVWNATASAYRTNYTIGPASVFQIALIIPGGAISSASSSSTSQDATVTLPSASTPGYTLISNTQLARAGGNSTKHGKCRRVVFQYSGSGNITITNNSSHPSYYTSKYTISIS